MHHIPYRIPSRQAGISTGGFLLVIVALILIGILALKMIPSYIQYFAVDDVVTGLTDDSTLRDGRMHPRQIRDLIVKRLRVNGVYEFDPDNIAIEKTKRGLNVLVSYEVREHVIGNVDVVMSFKSQADLWTKR